MRIEKEIVQTVEVGLKWICPYCHHENYIIEFLVIVTCDKCMRKYQADLPEIED